MAESRLALGTVQLGMPYGIANTAGRPDASEAAAIVAAARAGGIDTLDTAIGYGEAEAVLGAAGVTGFRVVSKVPPVPEDEADIAGWMRAMVEGSLARLGIARLHGLLLHAPAQLTGPRGAEIAEALTAVRRAGLTEKTGFSIYAPDTLEALCAAHAPGLVQAPLSLIDRRILTSGWAARLAASGCALHTRSAFLQGLLLMPPEDRPPHLARHAETWAAWDGWLAETGLAPAEACLRFVLSQPLVERAIVGVERAAQLADLLAMSADPLPGLPPFPDPPDPQLIDPSQWAQP